MSTDIKDRLEQTHPNYDAMVKRWERYRAMTGGIDSAEDKSRWLPRAMFESDSTYKTRLSLTHSLPLAPAAVRRVVGQLLKAPPVRDIEGEGMTAEVVSGLSEFFANADGKGTGINTVVKEMFWEALTMGAAFAVVDTDTVPESTVSLPFIEMWRAEEVINWGTDSKGLLQWVVLRRVVSQQDGYDSERRVTTKWRVLTRSGGISYTTSPDGKSVLVESEWEHMLGIVPIVPLFARKTGPMSGASYIDTISLADLRKLQFDSDQAMSSYLHGNPRLVIKTARDLDQIAADASQAIKLNPDDNEHAEYLSLDVTGMDIREKLVESVQKQALQASGIEPLVDHALQAREAASGAAMAWSFSRSEEPTLSALVDELDQFESRLCEVVARYLSPIAFVTTSDPAAKVFTGSIARSRQWDLLAVDRTVDMALAAWPLVSSQTWRQQVAADIATKLPGNTQPAIMEAILSEIASGVATQTEPSNGMNMGELTDV